MSTRRGTSTQVASSIPFVDTDNTYKPQITNVQSALVEIRNTRVSKVDTVTTSATTKVLTIDDTTFHEAEGTATGFAYRLPAGTSLSTGREYEIFNNSSESINIQDGASTVLLTLIAGEFVRLILVDNTTTAGQWIQIISSSTATGIQSYSVGSSTTFTTSSSTDVLITGMAITPVSGRYGIWYSSDIEISTNNRDAEVVIFIDGVALERTRRTVQGVSSNFKSSHVTIGEITVDGTEEVDIRVNISGGSLDVNSRRLLLIRLGS